MQFAAEGRMQALVFAVWPDLDRYVSIIPNDHQSLPVRRDRDHSLSIMGINLRLRDGQQMKAGALRVKSIDLQDIVPAAFVMQGICARALFQYVLVFFIALVSRILKMLLLLPDYRRLGKRDMMVIGSGMVTR